MTVSKRVLDAASAGGWVPWSADPPAFRRYVSSPGAVRRWEVVVVPAAPPSRTLYRLRRAVQVAGEWLVAHDRLTADEGEALEFLARK